MVLPVESNTNLILDTSIVSQLCCAEKCFYEGPGTEEKVKQVKQALQAVGAEN